MSNPLDWDNGGFWDSFLQWDGDAPIDVSSYVNLITSEHISRPNFIATISAITQPLVDNLSTLQNVQTSFDLDVAVGDQLDKLGQWIGISRNLNVALSGVYFSFDTTGVGFDQGTWLGPNDPSTGLVSLSDEPYRTLLRAKIAANSWNGTIPAAYAIFNQLFASHGYTIIIQDNGDMTMYWGIIGGAPDAVTIALLTGGYLGLRPSGVLISKYYVSSVPNTPLFGFDSTGPSIAGFDTGSWATPLTTT